MKRQPIFILAFSSGQAEQYRRDQGLSPAEVRFIISASVLRGHLDPDVRRVGNWYDRRDIREIETAIRTCRSPAAASS